jgi:glutamate carboxypeptidase
MKVTGSHRPVLEWIDQHADEIVGLLQRIVNIDSGTYDKPGVDAVARALRDFLVERGVHCEIIPVQGFGDVLRATVGAKDAVPIVLMGHRDTVFGEGEAKRRPFQVHGDRAYGPGVADMKAGLAMNAAILAAFASTVRSDQLLVGLFTGDEEIGSGRSRPFIEREARQARAVFNAEPGRVNGNVVTGRKGGIFFRCRVEGKPAHSGVNFSDGSSAIEEMAHKVLSWHALTNLSEGTTVNVGLLNGGQSVNSVAPSCVSEIDLRYVRPRDRDSLVNAIRAIAERTTVKGTSAKLEIIGEFLPLTETVASRAILERYIDAARAVGFTTAGEFTGSSADSGFSAAVGAPTLCGVGPVGGKVHTPEEYIEVPSLRERTKALALTIMNLLS